MNSSSCDSNAAPGPDHPRPARATGCVFRAALATLAALVVAAIAFGVTQYFMSRPRTPKDAPPATATPPGFAAGSVDSTAGAAAAPSKPRDDALLEMPSLPDAIPDVSPAAAAPRKSTGKASAGQRKDEVLALAERLRKDLPEGIESSREAAAACYGFGKTEEAARIWRAYLAGHPQDGEANAMLGMLVAEKGDHAEAVELLRKSLAAAPERPDTRAALADSLANLRRLDEARSVLEDDAKRFPNQVRTQFLLGRVHYDLGDFAKARQCYEAALRLEPDNTYAHHGAAAALSKLGDEKSAEEHRRRFKTLKQQDAEKERRRLAQLDDMAELTRRAAAFHLAAGNAYAKAGKYAPAEQAWRRTVELEPADVAARERLVWLYKNQRRLDEALATAEELRKLKPNDVEYCLSAGIVRALLGRYDEAEQVFREAIRLAPNRAAGYAALLQLHLQTDRKLPEALQLARTAVEKEPTARNYLNLCAACERNGDRNGALAAIEKALSLEPAHEQYRAIRDRIKAGR